MPSWSIPKGPSLDPAIKRLAMPTGNHDLEYRHFEGTIPGGRYGAGVVMIWDEGTYSPEVESEGGWAPVLKRDEADSAAAESLRRGELKLRLSGKKLKGSFALVKTRGYSGKESWLLIKHRDGYCVPGYDANDYDESAVSGRSLASIGGTGTLTT